MLRNPINVRLVVKVRGRELVKQTSLSTERPDEEDAATPLGVQLRRLARLPDGPIKTAADLPQEVHVDVLSGLPTRQRAIWVRPEKVVRMLDEELSLLEFVKGFETPPSGGNRMVFA